MSAGRIPSCLKTKVPLWYAEKSGRGSSPRKKSRYGCEKKASDSAVSEWIRPQKRPPSGNPEASSADRMNAVRVIARCIRFPALIERSTMSQPYNGNSGPLLSPRDTVGVALVVILFLVTLLSTVSPRALHAQGGARPEAIAGSLERRGRNLTALKAIMGVSTVYDRGKSRQEVRGFLLYRRPSDFRFQGVGPAGNSLFEMVLKHNNFELYVPADGKILKGGRRCFAKRFPDVAELEGLIPLVLLQWRNVRVVNMNTQNPDALMLAFKFKGTTWRATLEPKKLLLKRLEKMGSRSVELTADFGGYKSGKYGWLPRLFDVRSHSGGWRTVVKISKIEINPFLVEQNFKLETDFSARIENCK